MEPGLYGCYWPGIGNDCLFAGLLQLHSFENMTLKVKRTEIRNGSAVNVGATVMGGAILLATQSAERAGLGWLTTVAAGGIAGLAAYLLAARALDVREIDRFVSAVFGRSRGV